MASSHWISIVRLASRVEYMNVHYTCHQIATNSSHLERLCVRSRQCRTMRRILLLTPLSHDPAVRCVPLGLKVISDTPSLGGLGTATSVFPDVMAPKAMLCSDCVALPERLVHTPLLGIWKLEHGALRLRNFQTLCKYAFDSCSQTPSFNAPSPSPIACPAGGEPPRGAALIETEFGRGHHASEGRTVSSAPFLCHLCL